MATSTRSAGTEEEEARGEDSSSSSLPAAISMESLAVAWRAVEALRARRLLPVARPMSQLPTAAHRIDIDGGFEPRRRVESIAVVVVVAVAVGDMRNLAVVEARSIDFPSVFCAACADAATSQGTSIVTRNVICVADCFFSLM